MELRPLRTEADYRAALHEAEQLWEAPDNSRANIERWVSLRFTHPIKLNLPKIRHF